MSNEGKGVGAWDDEVERGEAEKQEEQEADAVAVSAAGEAEKQEEQEADAVAVSAAGDAASSVSQRESGSGTPKPEKKTLSESRGGPAGGAGGVGGKSGDSGGFGEIPTLLSEMMRLSTREREWDDDERGSGRLGWRSAYHGGGTRSEEKSGSSSYEWFDDLGERTGEGVGSSPRDWGLRPSWARFGKATGKNPVAPPGKISGGGRAFGSWGFDRTGEQYNLNPVKKAVAVAPLSGLPALGSWCRDSGSEPYSWTGGDVGVGGSGDATGDQERPRLALDPSKGGDNVVKEAPKSTESDLSGGVGVSGDAPGNQERPRLVLDPAKGGDNVMKAEAKVATSWASSSQSGVNRPETEEEVKLKEEIDHLKKELDGGNPAQGSTEDTPSLSDVIAQRERDLEQLTRQLDDKVRLGQQAPDGQDSESDDEFRPKRQD